MFKSTVTLSVLACAAGGLFATAASADRSDLVSFLERAARMGAYTSPVRADIKVTKTDGTTFDAVAIIDSKAQALFFSKTDGSWRALTPLSWKRSGKSASEGQSGLRDFGVDGRLANTDLRPIDFFPYWADSSYDTAFISDNTRMQKTVTLYAPDEIPYVLFVVTFDKEKIVPLTTKYYVGAMNNLVRLRTDSDHVMVGARPRPTKIVIDNYEDNTKTVYELRWQVLESVPPGVMDEAAFSKAAIEG
jgi:hypothetical protein